MDIRYYRWFRQCFCLLQVGLGGIGLMVLFTACFGQPCPVGVPAPPHAELVVDNGIVYASPYYPTGSSPSPAMFGIASILRADDGSRLGDTGVGKSFLGASNGLIYVIDQQHMVQALRANDRSLVWQYQSGSVDGFAVADGTIYLAEYVSTPTIVALRANDGSVLWQYQSQGLVQRFSVGGGFVSFVEQGTLVTLRASDGMLLWQQDFRDYFISFLAVENGVLYVDDSRVAETYLEVQALRASDGAVLWRQNVQQGQQQLLAVEGGVAYLYIADTNDNESLKALRATDGTLLWQKGVKNASSMALLADTDTLYLAFYGQLYAWRTSDGTQIWQHQLRTLDGGNYRTVAVEGGAVYVAIGGLFHYGSGCGITEATYGVETVRASDGKLLWSYQR